MNIRKIITILNYLAFKVPRMTKLKIVKLLYFADKEHIIRYGRYLTEDRYVKMKNGPAPTRILNFINSPNDYIYTRSEKKYLDNYISFADSNYRTITSNNEPDLKILSASEIEVLDYIISEYGLKSAGELVDLSHLEKSWIKANEAGYLKTEDIISEVEPKKKEQLLNYLHQQNDDARIINTIFN